MKKPAETTLAISADYRQFVEELKARVATARLSAARRINHEMILLYWDIGRGIVEKQQALGWGESVVEMVAADLRQAFPSMSGFSPRNVWYMPRLYEAYTAPEILEQAVREISKRGANSILPQPVAESAGDSKWRQPVANLGAPNAPSRILQQPAAELGKTIIWPQPVAKLGKGHPGQFLPQLVAEIPWGHHRFILDKLSDPAARLWYLRATARFGWSRNVLLNQIKAGSYERAVTEKKTHNFDLALPEHFAEQADEMLKSSYSLDFLGLRGARSQRRGGPPDISRGWSQAEPPVRPTHTHKPRQGRQKSRVHTRTARFCRPCHRCRSNSASRRIWMPVARRLTRRWPPNAANSRPLMLFEGPPSSER